MSLNIRLTELIKLVCKIITKINFIFLCFSNKLFLLFFTTLFAHDFCKKLTSVFCVFLLKNLLSKKYKNRFLLKIDDSFLKL